MYCTYQLHLETMYLHVAPCTAILVTLPCLSLLCMLCSNLTNSETCADKRVMEMKLHLHYLCSVCVWRVSAVAVFCAYPSFYSRSQRLLQGASPLLLCSLSVAFISAAGSSSIMLFVCSDSTSCPTWNMLGILDLSLEEQQHHPPRYCINADIWLAMRVLQLFLVTQASQML